MFMRSRIKSRLPETGFSERDVKEPCSSHREMRLSERPLRPASAPHGRKHDFFRSPPFVGDCVHNASDISADYQALRHPPENALPPMRRMAHPVGKPCCCNCSSVKRIESCGMVARVMCAGSLILVQEDGLGNMPAEIQAIWS